MPYNPLKTRSPTAATRPVSSVVTPYHSPRGASDSQLSLRSQLSAVRRRSRAPPARACRFMGVGVGLRRGLLPSEWIEALRPGAGKAGASRAGKGVAVRVGKGVANLVGKGTVGPGHGSPCRQRNGARHERSRKNQRKNKDQHRPARVSTRLFAQSSVCIRG